MRAGGYVLGVRVNSPETERIVCEVFADRVVADASPPPNLSLWLEPGGGDGPTELHRLYLTFDRYTRTRSVERALADLWHLLDMHDQRDARSALLVEAAAVIQGDRAHLLPARWRQGIVDQERPWARDGLLLADRTWLTLDPAAGTVTVPPLPPSVTEAIEGHDHTGFAHRPEAHACPEGTFSIGSWSTRSAASSGARRAMHAANGLLDRDRVSAETVASVLRLLEDLPDHAPDRGFFAPDDLRAALLEREP